MAIGEQYLSKRVSYLVSLCLRVAANLLVVTFRGLKSAPDSIENGLLRSKKLCL